MAIPAILYNIADPLIGLVDTAVIGQMTKDTVEAQAGIGLSAGLIATLIWGLAQIRTAVSSLVSQYLGKNALSKVSSLIPQSLYFSALVGVFFGIITAYFFVPISHFLFEEDSPKVIGYANEYYQIRAIGLPLSLLIASFFGIFRGFQNTRFAMYAAFLGAGINILLDLILVNGWLFIPAMGVSGVAIASVISQFAMVLLCAYFLKFKTPFDLKLKFPLHPEFNNMLQIAGNMLIRTLALNLAFLLALRFASKYGTDMLAAYSIGIQIWLFSSFFIDGYSSAGNAIGGKLLGSGNFEKLNLLVRKLLRINIFISIILGVIYLLVYFQLGYWFNKSLAVNRAFQSFFWIIIIAQPLNSIAFTMDGIFKGMGKAKLLRNTLLIGTFGIFIPCLYLADWMHWQIFSIWLAFLLWMAFRGGSLVIWFNRKIAHADQLNRS